MKKNCFKYKEMLKKKVGPRADEIITSGKQLNQASVATEAIKEPGDVLSVNPDRDREFSDAWLFDSGTHTSCAQGRSGSAYMSLVKEAQSSWITCCMQNS